MKHSCLVIAFVLLLVLQPSAQGDDPVFSGPQVGETLPSFTVTSVLGDTAGQEVDIVKQADGKPIVLVFVHSRTRPGFGLANLLMRYTSSRVKEGLHSGVVFLTDDATKTEQWMRVVKQHFSEGSVIYGISHEGQEGPGSYGLNRNMTLTILVGKEGKVTANYALVQPSNQADGPKILKDIVDAMGGGEVPTLAQLGGMRYQNADRDKMMRKADGNDPRLATLVRNVIDKDAGREQVEAAIAKVEEYIAKNEQARTKLGKYAAAAVKSGTLGTYGTKLCQRTLRKWAKEYGPAQDGKKDESKRGE